MAESLRELESALRDARRKAQWDRYNDSAQQREVDAMRALCDALLTSRAVEAVEVLRAYGAARRKEVTDGPMTHGSPKLAEERLAARDAVNKLADALAGEV